MGRLEPELLDCDCIFRQIKEPLLEAQAWMKAQADKHHSEQTFEVGD